MERKKMCLKKDKQKSKKTMGTSFFNVETSLLSRRIQHPTDELPYVNYWRRLFNNNTLVSIQYQIDEFVKLWGINYMFLNNITHSESCTSRPLKKNVSQTMTFGSLLHVALEVDTDLEIIKYLVKNKHANLNLTTSYGWVPLKYAVCSKRFDCALYLLEQKSTHYYDSILLDACHGSYVHLFGESKTEVQIIFIKALLKRGHYLNNEEEKNTNGINLAELRQEILVSNHHLMQEGHQLVPLTITRMTLELMDAVTQLLNIHGHTVFYCMNAITPPVEIDEIKLSVLITELEKKGTPLAYLVCGLLLEGQIENKIPDRYIDNEETEAYKAYVEKRIEDACTFYTKASADPSFKKVTDILLWQQKMQGPESVVTRLKQYDAVVPSQKLVPSYDDYAKDNAEMPWYRMV
jgi:hypothetical protein